MGIQGLLPLLKSTMEPIHVKELEGCRVAVDTYSWLHKGALSCSRDLCKGLPTSRHIEYCMHRVNLLQHYGVKPILVFDGGLLPMKIEQENKRARSRKENLARAMEHESNGNSAGAYECYQKAVDISPSIAHELIQVLKQENVSYVVAPYEADAQMTFLALSNQVHAVITEDSDLIPFGCPRIIYKMDKYGQGVEFQNSRLHQNKELSFAGFTKVMLLEMCILSGCDYLQSLPGMGLKRAHSLIAKFKSHDKVIRHLKYGAVPIPHLYEESFKKALLTFQHQRVYDPATEDIVHLLDIPDNLGNDMDFLGPFIPQHIAKGIAKGDLDPFTQMPFQETSVSFKPGSGRKKLDLPVQKNILTKYFCFASLEAKRKFSAPRMSPLSSSQEDNSALVSMGQCIVETSCNAKSSPASPDVPESARTILPSDIVDSGSAAEALDPSMPPSSQGTRNGMGLVKHSLPQHSDQIQQSYQALLRECDFKNIPNAACEKTRMENTKVMVRSSYFQHKSANKNNQDNEVKDNVDRDMHEDISVDGFKTREENKKVIVRSSYFQHKSANKNDQDNRDKDNVASDMNMDIGLDGCCKTRTANKKVYVSSYFQHKSANKNDQGIKQERLSIKDDMPTDRYKDIDLKNTYSESNYCNGITLKRKNSLDDDCQRENLKPKQMCMAAPLPSAGPNLDETLKPTKTEEVKFGSNISHLSCYTDIADKSMERFVSVISSFRCTSSGSRASGLRAPLKDIRNTCTSRPTGVDFSQFAYIPSKRKTDLPSRRH